MNGAQAIATLSKYRKEIAELTVSMQEVRFFPRYREYFGERARTGLFFVFILKFAEVCPGQAPPM